MLFFFKYGNLKLRYKILKKGFSNFLINKSYVFLYMNELIIG